MSSKSKEYSISSPDDVVQKIRDFLVNECGFTVQKEVQDDLDIFPPSRKVDGKLCVLKDPIHKYYIHFRSANGYPIWGNYFKANNIDRTNFEVSSRRYCVGILMSETYKDTGYWYEQEHAPLVGYEVQEEPGSDITYVYNIFGINLSCLKDLSAYTLCCNYIKDDSSDAYTVVIGIRETSFIVAGSYWQVVFGNLKLFNKKFIPAGGAYMLSSQVGDMTTIMPSQIIDEVASLTKNGDTMYYHQLNTSCLRIDIGDYVTQEFTDDYGSKFTGCWWARKYEQLDLPPKRSKQWLQLDESYITNSVEFITGTVNNVIGYKYPTNMNAPFGLHGYYEGGNKITSACSSICKSFGYPQMLGVHCEPLELNYVSPIGVIYGLYTVSSYDMQQFSYHTIYTYDGIKYCKIVYDKHERWHKGTFLAMAIIDSEAEAKLGDNGGSDVGL